MEYETAVDVCEGEEVEMNYGRRGNELLLIYSGFTTPNAPFSLLHSLPVPNNLLKNHIFPLFDSLRGKRTRCGW